MITMKNLFLTMAAFVATCAFAQLPTRIETFPVSNVRLAASQFKKNQQADISYLLGLDAD